MIGKVLKNEKNHIEVEITNTTIAELLRTCLWEDPAVKFSAWKRVHLTESPVLIVKTEGKTAQKAISDCIERVDKMAKKVLAEFKKSVKK